MKTYFEISPAGQIISSHDTDSMRLYPYVDIVDYVTLAAQLLFIALTVVKLLFFVYSLTKCSFTGAAAFHLLVELIGLCLALGYVVFYIWRIDRTIYTVEVLMNNKGEYAMFKLRLIELDLIVHLYFQVMLLNYVTGTPFFLSMWITSYKAKEKHRGMFEIQKCNVS